MNVEIIQRFVAKIYPILHYFEAILPDFKAVLQDYEAILQNFEAITSLNVEKNPCCYMLLLVFTRF